MNLIKLFVSQLIIQKIDEWLVFIPNWFSQYPLHPIESNDLTTRIIAAPVIYEQTNQDPLKGF